MLPIFLLTHFSLSAATYYFSASHGDDSRSVDEAKNPETPWRTLSKLNDLFETLQPGDSILLRRNDVFDGFLALSSSGTASKPIVVSAYGGGHPPVINGWRKATSFTATSKKGIWKTQTESNAMINVVEIQGELQEKGRYPNEGMIEYQVDESGNVSFPNSPAPSHWKNSTLVMRKNQWIIDKVKPLQYSDVFTLSTDMQYPPIAGFGMIIQDHLNVLDRYGEWYFESETGYLYIYSESLPMSERAVRYSFHKNLVFNTRPVHHIRLVGLCLSGANQSAISISSSFDIQITDSRIEYSGEDAVYVVDSPNFKFLENTIDFALNNGVFLRYGSPNSVISGNKISNIHPFFGGGKSGDGNGIGIFNISDGATISKNTIENIGYSAIVFGGNQSEVIDNHIRNFCLIKNDGGGIYTYEGKANIPRVKRIVKGNFIENGKGTTLGTRHNPTSGNPQVEGIYIDDNASGILVEANLIVGMRRNGIHIHNGRNISIIRNIVADCLSQLAISDDELGDSVFGLTVRQNVFASFHDSQYSVVYSSKTDNFTSIASFVENKFVNPLSSRTPFQIRLQKPTRDYDTYFYSIQNFVDKGIFADSSNYSYGVKVPEIHEVGDPLHIPPSSTREYCDGCEIKKTPKYVEVTFEKSHSPITLGVLGKIEHLPYRLDIETISDKSATLLVQFRKGSTPWSNLSDQKAILIEPGNQIHSVYFRSIASASDIALLISAQTADVTLSMKRISLQALGDHPIELPKLIHNTTNASLTLPKGFVSIPPYSTELPPKKAAIQIE